MTPSFRIASSFTESLGRLSAAEQSAAKLAVFDLQTQGASPGERFHRLDKAKDKSFWSVRVNADLRLIVHRSEGSLLLCYVGHHDDAYRWAESRRIERHPTTGAAQIVELRETVRETVREVVVPKFVEAPEAAPEPAKKLSAAVPRDELLAYGVPEEWISEVAEATEATILEIADHLPAEAAEALLELATGGRPGRPVQAPAGADPFAHPDAQRRFRLMANVEELERALEFPWEKWMVFLHPAQREIVEKSYGGPARVAGSAGTGKSIVALHRAVHLARSHPEARVLLATFSEPFADAWQIESWEQYRDVQRLGRKTRLAETQRSVLWSIFSLVCDRFASEGLLTGPGIFRRLERHLAQAKRPPFDFAVIDEAQDLGVAELRFLAALGGARDDQRGALFFAGDLGQRIFQTPFSWRSLGVDVRGRSQTLRINYRTSHQIRRQADRTRCCRSRRGSRPSSTRPTSKTSTTPSGTCSMSPAHGRATGCW